MKQKYIVVNVKVIKVLFFYETGLCLFSQLSHISLPFFSVYLIPVLNYKEIKISVMPITHRLVCADSV